MPEILGLQASTDDLIHASTHMARAWVSGRRKAGDPIADEVLDRDGNLGDFACAIGEQALAAQGKTPRNRSHAIAWGMRSRDFGIAFATGLREFVYQRLAATSDHRDLCLFHPAQDFREVEFPTIALDDPLPEIVREGQEIPRRWAAYTPGVVQRVHSRAANLIVSAEALMNDDHRLVERTLSAMAEAALAAEHRAVIHELENPDDLGDDDAFFSTGAGNVVAGQSFGKAGVAAGMAALRTQQVNGEPANYPTGWLIVHADHELESREILRDITHGDQAPPRLLVSPYLAASRFYVAASREQAAAIAFMTFDRDPRRMASMGLDPISPRAMPIDVDGVGFRVRADFAAKAVSRTGIVRVDSEE
ncbi:MAG: hypothetical protein JJU06_06695 [Ectothiorhodospiraceae bacterium]|nr:hypothetical protein [Ectothiorhodospiraceae bacterium]